VLSGLEAETSGVAGVAGRVRHTGGSGTYTFTVGVTDTASPADAGSRTYKFVVSAYDPTAQRLVSYLVSTMPPGNVRVSTRFKLTQLSSAVKNGVPPPTKTG
jgi:hypothetical protein